ncbi:MAG: hypothetical protein NWT12_05575 [Paracoccaceae bacterium]|nr:hypothetical protein [Paracoccaceae bacterium]
MHRASALHQRTFRRGGSTLAAQEQFRRSRDPESICRLAGQSGGLRRIMRVRGLTCGTRAAAHRVSRAKPMVEDSAKLTDFRGKHAFGAKGNGLETKCRQSFT